VKAGLLTVVGLGMERGSIDYKELRRFNVEAARRAVLEYLKANSNISEAARMFGITRAVVYDILKKEQAGNLRDRSRAPQRQPRRTPAEVEGKVIMAKNKTHLGPERLSRYLQQYEGLSVPVGTIRHILRRNRARLEYPLRRRRPLKGKREFVDWYSAKPFEIVQMDVKYIRDRDALTEEQIIHLDSCRIPNFQWGALEVNTRFKMIAYSREKTWTNGLCWYLWVISWLRSHGVKSHITFTVDNGEEFGGKSWMKVQDLRKLIGGFGCRLIRNRRGHAEENAHIERSHRTDDEEFYIPRVLNIKNEADLLKEAMGYIYYYDNVREHSSLDYETPFAHLKSQIPDINDTIRFIIPIMLDDVSVRLGPWSGYHLLAQHQSGVGSSPGLPEVYPPDGYANARHNEAHDDADPAAGLEGARFGPGRPAGEEFAEVKAGYQRIIVVFLFMMAPQHKPNPSEEDKRANNDWHEPCPGH
jgi:transposase-like protein